MRVRESAQKRMVRTLACSAVLAAMGNGPARAAQWSLENGWIVNFDSTVSLGVAVRTSKPKCSLIGNDNGGCVGDAVTPLQASNPSAFFMNLDTLRLNQDDGNLNFRRGQVASANLQYTADLFVRASDGWSGLLRGVVNRDFRAGHTHNPLDPDAKDFADGNPRWLDAYINKKFDIAGKEARIRVGNQVLSWGENLFITGGINSINPLYLPAAHQPGTPLKTLFIPSPMVSASFALAPGLGIEGYYQWKWNSFAFDAPGTFFSTSDFVGRGGRGLHLPASVMQMIGAPADMNLIPRGADRMPKNGQGGAALRYQFPGSGNELGVYYYRYNDKVPFVSYQVTGTPSNPFGWEAALDYGKNRQLFGVSYNFQAGEWAIGTELSYRPRAGVAIDPSTVIDPANRHYCNALADFTVAPVGHRCQGWVDTQHYQWHLTGIHILSPSGSLGGLLHALGASEGTITAETAVAYYPKLKFGQDIPYAATADYRLPTKASWGMVVAAGLTYPNIFGTRASLSPDIAVSQGLSGISATATPGFVKGAGAVVLGATLDFKTKPETKLRVDFTQNWGGGASNRLRDRNFMSVSLSSSF